MLNAQCYSCIGHLTQVHPLQLIWESRDAYSVDTQIIRRCSKIATRLNSGAIHASSCCESCSDCIYFIGLILPCKAGRVPMQPDQAALAVSIHTYISDPPAAQATRRCGGGFLVRVPSSYRYSWHNRFDRFETEFASESVLFRYMRIVRTGSLQSVSTLLFDFSLAVSRGYYSPLGLRRDWCISKLT